MPRYDFNYRAFDHHKQTGAILYATHVATAKGSTTFYSVSDRPLSFHAIDSVQHAIEAPTATDGLKADPRILDLFNEAKGA